MSSSQYAPISDALTGLRQHAKRAALRQALSEAAVALCVGVGVAVGVAELGFARVALGVFGAAWLVAFGVLAWRHLRNRREERDVELAPARLAQSLAPELGTATMSAVELGRLLAAPDVRFSRNLAEAHLERTAQALAGLDLQARLQARN